MRRVRIGTTATAGMRRGAGNDTGTRGRYGLQVGAVLDKTIGERLFLRASVRMWFQTEVGVGLKLQERADARMPESVRRAVSSRR